MSTYKELHGRSIIPASSNPAASGDAGKIFYNSTDNVFRSIVASEAFSSGANLATGRAQGSGAGTQTAALFVGEELVLQVTQLHVKITMELVGLLYLL